MLKKAFFLKYPLPFAPISHPLAVMSGFSFFTCETEISTYPDDLDPPHPLNCILEVGQSLCTSVHLSVVLSSRYLKNRLNSKLKLRNIDVHVSVW